MKKPLNKNQKFIENFFIKKGLKLLVDLSKKKKPTIISTGMSSMKEVKETVNLVKKINNNIAIMQCTSAYPCPYNISDIGVISTYLNTFNFIIGFGIVFVYSSILVPYPPARITTFISSNHIL